MDKGLIRPAWANWFMQVNRGVAFYGSGTTADRPALSGLKVGGYYFDISLGANGKPVWVNKSSTGWIDATGAAA